MAFEKYIREVQAKLGPTTSPDNDAASVLSLRNAVLTVAIAIYRVGEELARKTG